MNKKIFIILIIVVIIFVIVVRYIWYLNQIDTQYAVRFSKVFKEYNINDIDNYLSQDTKIICNDKSKTYKELRNNVILSCNEKRYLFHDGSSYGYGNNKFINNTQNIKIRLYGELDGDSIGECIIFMQLERIGLFKFKIVAIECDEPIFEYLFFNKFY